MNFGPKVQTAIRIIYAASLTLVWINGQSSKYVYYMSRGTRQGCPLLPLLFALGIEPLAETLRKLEVLFWHFHWGVYS